MEQHVLVPWLLDSFPQIWLRLNRGPLSKIFFLTFLVGLLWEKMLLADCIKHTIYSEKWLTRWCSGKESACQCRRCRRLGFDSWVKKIPCRRKWQPTPVSLPEKSHWQRSLVGYNRGSCKELDMTEDTHNVKSRCLLLTPDRVLFLWRNHSYQTFLRPHL